MITKEYPKRHEPGDIPFYPVNDKQNQEVYKLYRNEGRALRDYIFGGRLSEYKYMDMHVVIESAMNKFRNELKKSDSMLN